MLASAVSAKLASAAQNLSASPAIAVDVFASAIARRLVTPTLVASPAFVGRVSSEVGRKAASALDALTTEPVDIGGLEETEP
ncbi:MAG TPA: hypothetical protein VHQ96_00155 [Gaiellaceae bacterium]|nr:hypothetical protein [Gaiellaceae bacterium]